MTRTQMTFGELVATARGAGFELYDAGRMPVDPELQPAFEDDNLMSETVAVDLRTAPGDSERGVVADITVRDEVFHLWGEWSRQWELERLLTGASTKDRDDSWGQ